MNVDSGLRQALVVEQSNSVVISLSEFYRIDFYKQEDTGCWRGGNISLWDQSEKAYCPIWRFSRGYLLTNTLSGMGLIQPSKYDLVYYSDGLAVKFPFRIPNEQGSDLITGELTIRLFNNCRYIDWSIEFKRSISGVLLENIYTELESADLWCGVDGIVPAKYEVGLHRLYVLNTASLPNCLDIRFLEGIDFVQQPVINASQGKLGLQLGSYPCFVEHKPPNEYLMARSSFGRPLLAADKVYKLRWLMAVTFGDEADFIKSDMPLEPWSQIVKARNVPDNPYLTWLDFTNSFDELYKQLDAFPHIYFNGRDAGWAPYKQGMFSNFTQWFYQPQVYGPLIIALLRKGKSIGKLVSQLKDRLWVHSADDEKFHPVNSINRSGEMGWVAPAFHWGWGLVGISILWNATGDHDLLSMLEEAIIPYLPAIQGDSVPRIMQLESGTFNTQPRYGTNGLWAFGLLNLYQGTKIDEYLVMAKRLLDGANRHQTQWSLLGGIEDWPGMKPDGVAQLGMANGFCYELTGEDHYLSASRFWTLCALNFFQISNVNGSFENMFPSFGNGVSNIGWCRAAQYPDSDGRCEASLETITASNSIIVSTRWLRDDQLARIAEFIAVIRKTHLSFCMRGCNGDRSGISLIAHELHDNNTDILHTDRLPLVASYMCGAPALEALAFTSAGCMDERVLCVDRSILWGHLEKADILVYNPSDEIINTMVKCKASTWQVQLNPGEILTLSD